jgi:hypothetical protein
MIYEILDKFFLVFHSLLIIFLMTGWMWRKTRKINLVILFLTAFSWFILGLWYGFGYCPSTDWHWQIRMKLGHCDMPPSYLVFLIRSVTGLEPSQQLVDIFAVMFLFLAIGASLLTNFRDWKKSRRMRSDV